MGYLWRLSNACSGLNGPVVSWMNKEAPQFQAANHDQAAFAQPVYG